ncbi:TPA: GFA family protein [Pseudomonas putida]
MKIQGGCRCGAVSYHATSDAEPAVYACHCLYCQAWSGSSFALHALLPEGAFTLEGPIEEYSVDSGHHRACAVCHTRIYNTTPAAPGIWVLRAGTLVQRARLTPVAHIWVRHKQPWLALPPEVPTWDESPTPEAFAAALAPASAAQVAL